MSPTPFAWCSSWTLPRERTDLPLKGKAISSGSFESSTKTPEEEVPSFWIANNKSLFDNYDFAQKKLEEWIKDGYVTETFESLKFQTHWRFRTSIEKYKYLNEVMGTGFGSVLAADSGYHFQHDVYDINLNE